jgi:hypothetical protein
MSVVLDNQRALLDSWHKMPDEFPMLYEILFVAQVYES